VGGELKKLQSAQDVLHWMGAFPPPLSSE
jgi:hypothetical protein